MMCILYMQIWPLCVILRTSHDRCISRYAFYALLPPRSGEPILISYRTYSLGSQPSYQVMLGCMQWVMSCCSYVFYLKFGVVTSATLMKPALVQPGLAMLCLSPKFTSDIMHNCANTRYSCLCGRSCLTLAALSVEPIFNLQMIYITIHSRLNKYRITVEHRTL